MPARSRAGSGTTPMGAKAPPVDRAKAKAFFENVAGTRSPLNNQTSRIRDPFAVYPALGGGDKTSRVPPAQQAQLAASLDNSKNVPKADKKAALKIEQNYVKGQDTVKPDSNGNILPGAAVTGADPATVAQRGLALAAAGRTLGSAAPGFIHAVSRLGLPNDQRQQVIAGFSKDKSLDQPYARGMLVAEAMAKGYGIPAHATTAQLLEDAFGQGQHHSLGDIINPINIAKDLVLTPVFAAEGGFAFGHAARAAAGGNWSELAAIGKSQLQQIQHPILSAEKNPVQTALAIAAPIKGLGKLGGKVAGLEATPREITLDPAFSGSGKVLDRGDYSTNLVDRGFEKLSDARVARSTKLQDKLLRADTRREQTIQTSRLAREAKPDQQLMDQGGAGIARSRKSSLLANEAAGGTAQEFADHYNKLADHNESIYNATGDKTKLKLATKQRAQAAVRQQQADRWKGPLTDQEQAFLDAHREAGVHRTGSLIHEGVLDRTNALWRDYQHNIDLRAGQGNERAIAVKQARNVLDEIPGHQTSKGFKPDDPAAYELAHEHLGAALDHYIMQEDGIHAAGLAQHHAAPDELSATPATTQAVWESLSRDGKYVRPAAKLTTSEPATLGAPPKPIHPPNLQPFRVPLHEIKGASVGGRIFGGGRSLAAKTDIKSSISDLGHSSGQLFEGGNYTVRPEDFTQQIIEPHRALAGQRYAQTLLNRYGTPGREGVTLPEGQSWVQNRNVKSGLRGVLNATPTLEDHAAQLANVRDDFKVALDDSATQRTYPQGAHPGSYVAMPNPVIEQVAQTLDRVKPTAFHKLTRAYKKSVLYSRIAYPLSNFVNSAAQSALGGVTAGAIRHRNAIETPDGLLGHGFVGGAYLPEEGRIPGLRGTVDEMRMSANPYDKAGALLRGAGRTAAVVPDKVRKWSVEADDFWRKALYAKKAYADARKIAYPDEGSISRLLRHRSIADKEILDAYHQMANGTTEQAARAAARAMKSTQDFLGDFENMKRYDWLDLALPFNSWTRFSANLLFKTLPLKYPGRTLLLYKIGQLGQQATAQQGVLPQYLQESIPLGGSDTKRYGAYFTRANPFGTLGSEMEPIVPGQKYEGTPNFAGLVTSGLNPVFGAPLNAVAGVDLGQGGRTLRDENGDPIFGNPVAIGRYLAAQTIGVLPPVVAASGGTRGKADTSLPFISEQNRSVAKDPIGGPQSVGPTVNVLGLNIPILPLLNQVSPVRIDVRNMTADQIKGFKAMSALLRHEATHGADAKALSDPNNPDFNAALTRALTGANKLAGQLNLVTLKGDEARKIQEQGRPGK